MANLGQANVMLSYPIDEAEELLTSKLKAAKTSLSNCEEDLDFLREQITVGHTPLQPGLFFKLIGTRLWRLPLRESITGMSCKSARKRRKRRSKMRNGKERGPRCHREAEK